MENYCYELIKMLYCQVCKNAKCLFSSNNPSTAKILSKSWYKKLFNSFQATQSIMFTHRYWLAWTRVTNPVENYVWLKAALVILYWICHHNLKVPVTYLEPFQINLGLQITLNKEACEQSVEGKKKTFLKIHHRTLTELSEVPAESLFSLLV